MTKRIRTITETAARSSMHKSALNDQGAIARTRSTPDITRKHVLGTVYELISEHGIESLSMRQVAEATGLSTGTINYHFGNKHSLLIAAFESAYALPVDWEEYRGSPSAQLRRLVLGHVCRWAKDRFWRFWINYLAFSTRDEQLLEHQKMRYARQQRFWTRLIEDGMAIGEFRKDINATLEAGRFLHLSHGLLIQQLIEVEAETRTYVRDMRDILNAAMNRLLAA